MLLLRLAHRLPAPVPLRDIRRVHPHRDQPAVRVDQEEALAPEARLARVVAAKPPLSVVGTD